MIKTLRGEHGADLATNFLSHKVKPSVSVKVPGAVAAWQIILSRNGKYALINSADCALRLYDTEEILRQSESDVKQISPRFVFQDTLSRSPWASCDFSADGEYVVGGCNSYPQPGDNYNLFMWNTITGELVDQLKGPQVSEWSSNIDDLFSLYLDFFCFGIDLTCVRSKASLYSLSCHPTRSFIAVGTSDGVIDIYGPQVQWAAFAPDFQARQANVLYEEKEVSVSLKIKSSILDLAHKAYSSTACLRTNSILLTTTKEMQRVKTKNLLRKGLLMSSP